MSFFGRIFSQFFQEFAVNKLASSKSFQQFAVRTVDAHTRLQAVAKQAAEDPAATKVVIQDGAKTFWQTMRAEMEKDLERLNASFAEAPAASTRTAAAPASASASGSGSAPVAAPQGKLK